jgi:hypothetical protein
MVLEYQTQRKYTSTVSANTTSGFSIVSYTGNGTNATVGHGLGVAPDMIITKVRANSGNNWAVFHKSLGAGNIIWLNLTNAKMLILLFGIIQHQHLQFLV